MIEKRKEIKCITYHHEFGVILKGKQTKYFINLLECSVMWVQANKITSMGERREPSIIPGTNGDMMWKWFTEN